MGSTSTGRGDAWTSGDAYEAYIGRWSRVVAREFIPRLARPAGTAWLDVGCGTGALTAVIVTAADPSSVVGVDPSEGFLEVAAARLPDPRVRFVLGSGDALPLDAASVDTAVSGLVLNFLPDPVAMLAEMRRVTRPGGVVAVYVWDYAGRMDLIRRFWDAAVALDPAAEALDEGRRFPICAPEPLVDAAEAAGLRDPSAAALDIETPFRDADDLWVPFLSTTGPAPGYVMGLDDDRRAALRRRFLASLPAGADGPIRLLARAWVLRASA
ncbi:MAG TPA: class I SAM-dependent methyltransferase [Candidatus Saccharimonadales bacterium]|nr:class I SAM-dependent methyltransferase [Candidatus Saccharimonadales bacterium]